MRHKTFKREVALGLLFFIVYLALTGDIEVLEIITGPFVLFAMGSFGMDAIAKQISVGGKGRFRYDRDSEMGSDSPDSGDADRSGYSDSELHRK